MIEIELYTNFNFLTHMQIHPLFFPLDRFNAEKGSNWIVNRSLHTNSTNKWTLNGKQTTEAAVIHRPSDIISLD